MRRSTSAEQIAELVAQRKITRVCHFTTRQNLIYIGDVGGILANADLRMRSVPARINDKHRYDNHQGYVCTSIQYPNVRLLSDFADRFGGEWIVLLIRPEVLETRGTLFSDTNASSAGAVLKPGLEGLERLFSDRWRLGTRTTQHLASTPTDLQAEALIPTRIENDLVYGVAVPDQGTAHDLEPSGLITPFGKLGKIVVWPRAFDRELDDDVRRGHLPEKGAIVERRGRPTRS